jgi:hypothetical protein
LISAFLWLFIDLTDVNVSTVSNKQKNTWEKKTYFLLESWNPLKNKSWIRIRKHGSGSVSSVRYVSKDSDSYKNFTDPEHCFVCILILGWQGKNIFRLTLPYNIVHYLWSIQDSLGVLYGAHSTRRLRDLVWMTNLRLLFKGTVAETGFSLIASYPG